MLADIGAATTCACSRCATSTQSAPTRCAGPGCSTTTAHALGQLITAYEAGTTFTVTGTDWPTRDGSAIRDFVHVWDLARAHVAALPRFDTALEGASQRAVDLGNGQRDDRVGMVEAFCASRAT